MPKYIKKKDLKNAIDECTWYHINKNGELVEGAGVDDEPLYKYSDIKKIIKGLPTRKFEDEPHIVGKHADVIIIDEPWYKEEPKDEPQTNKGVSYSDHTDYDEPKTYVTWTEPTDCAWK